MTSAPEPGTTRYATPNDRELVITRVVQAPRELVFDAWTNPRHLPNWMTGPEGWTMPICEIDLRPGGSWHYVWRKSDGTEMGMSGAVVDVVRPARLVTTERWGPEWPETTNTLLLTEMAGRTTITQTITYPSKEARDAALQTGMKEGMEQSFVRLETLLAELR